MPPLLFSVRQLPVPARAAMRKEQLMTGLQIAAIAVIAVFYIAYFMKMILQRRKGLQTDQMGKGDKPKKVLRIERSRKIATYAIVPVELVSIFSRFQLWDVSALCWTGVGAAAVGYVIFILAMTTMRDSWRAGISESDRTALVTTGIYRISRNPAFLGFDLMYLGLLIAFFNPVHLIFVGFAMTMLHLQILQEEQFLALRFGSEYAKYKERIGRYFIF